MTATRTEPRLRAAATLVALASVLPEMLSGNTPAPVLFRPDALVFFGLAYGLPVLVLREWAQRRALGPAGLFAAGLGYGLVNEGLLAKTIFRASGVPIDLFDHYGVVAGINWPWALFIAVWHGLSSVLLPVVLAHRLVPGAARVAWLGRRSYALLAILAVALPSLFFLADDAGGSPGSPGALIALWAAIGLSLIVGGRLRAAASAPPGGLWAPFLAGLAGLPVMIALLLLVRARVPVAVFAGALAATILAVGALLRRRGWLAAAAGGWLAFGWYLQMAAFGAIAMVQRSPATVVVDTLALGLIALGLARVGREGPP